MSASAAGTDPRERLRVTSRALQELHRTLLDYQRRDYEKSFGRIGSDFYVLKLAADDPQFAWLRALSAEMMRIDIALSDGDVDDGALQLTGTRLRQLLAPNVNGTSFQARYDEAMQANPSIIMAHAAVMRSLPPARATRLFRSQPPTDVRTDDAVPGFEVRLHRPGELVPGHGDHGYRALAAAAEVILQPGTIIPMHAQANEEVISWVPDGVMIHEDAAGNAYPVDPGHLAVMNAGSGIRHAERVAADAPAVRMIQFFVRPAALRLEPAFQYGPVAQEASGQWRELVGPEGEGAPFYVRNSVAMSDITLAPGQETLLPRRDGWDTWFFVYDGEVEVDGVAFSASESGLVSQPGNVPLRAVSAARMAAFVIDPRAKVTRAGTTGR